MRILIDLIENLMTSETETAVKALLDAFVKSDRNTIAGDINSPETRGSEVGAGLRYWGDERGYWQVPAGEEDDGDYDWKELTPEAKQHAATIIAEVQQRFPNIDLSYSVEEKYWIWFVGRPRS
jgi:hypothetical protein